MERWYLRVVMVDSIEGELRPGSKAGCVELANKATPKPVEFEAKEGRLEVVYDLGEHDNVSAYTAGAKLVAFLSARISGAGGKLDSWRVLREGDGV